MNNPHTKKILSLSAIMFFALFVRKWLKKWETEISSSDMQFVKFYIQLWLINTTILMISIWFFLLSFIFNISLLSLIWNWIIIFLVGLIIIEILLIIVGYYWETSIDKLKNQNYTHHLWDTKQDRYIIIRNYMPFYTVYRRYTLANFDKPYRWVKESLFLRTIFTIILFSQNIYLVWFIFFIILFRIWTLYFNIDVINNEYKHKINSFFKVNPEEMFWYVVWGCKYLIHKYVLRKKEWLDFWKEVFNYKENYMKLNKISKNILIQYLILSLLILSLIILSQQDLILRLFIVFIVWRYILLWVFEKKLPNLPIIHDVLKIFYQKSHLNEVH